MTTETKDTTYNGWTNYETWAVNLWLTNEPGTYYGLAEIVNQGGMRIERADALKEYVEEVYEIEAIAGLAADLVNAALSSVNWLEIIENHEED